MVYRTAIVGARRGLHHAQAYSGLEHRMRVVAFCDADSERRDEAARRFHVPTYAEYEAMLAQERPDIVHIVTGPQVPRARWVYPAARSGVRVLALEKPLALTPGEATDLAAAAHGTDMRIAVNHQRRYMPFADTLLDLLGDQQHGLGAVHFVRASTYGRVLDMSTHLLDLVLLALGDEAPGHVWAVAEGREHHPLYPGPRHMMATFSFPGGARAFYEASPEGEAPYGSRDFGADYPSEMPAYGPHRLNIDISADHGRFWWREWGTWGYEVAGHPRHRAVTAFSRDDMPAQRAYTAALADWIEGTPHRCRLEVARIGFDALLGAQKSALAGRRLPFPEAAAFSDEERLRLLDGLGDGTSATG